MSHYIAESVEALKKKSATKGRLYESRGRYSSENTDGYRVGERDGSDSEVPPSIDFTADPDVVRVVVEGERLTYGHLFNPAFATEISLIEPLPTSASRSMIICCNRAGCVSCWPTMLARGRRL